MLIVGDSSFDQVMALILERLPCPWPNVSSSLALFHQPRSVWHQSGTELCQFETQLVISREPACMSRSLSQMGRQFDICLNAQRIAFYGGMSLEQAWDHGATWNDEGESIRRDGNGQVRGNSPRRQHPSIGTCGTCRTLPVRCLIRLKLRCFSQIKKCFDTPGYQLLHLSISVDVLVHSYAYTGWRGWISRFDYPPLSGLVFPRDF